MLCAHLDLWRNRTRNTEQLNNARASWPSPKPPSNRSLDTQLALKGPEWRRRIQGPVAPGGAREAILEEHADDRHHRQAPARARKVKFDSQKDG